MFEQTFLPLSYSLWIRAERRLALDEPVPLSFLLPDVSATKRSVRPSTAVRDGCTTVQQDTACRCRRAENGVGTFTYVCPLSENVRAQRTPHEDSHRQTDNRRQCAGGGGGGGGGEGRGVLGCTSRSDHIYMVLCSWLMCTCLSIPSRDNRPRIRTCSY